MNPGPGRERQQGQVMVLFILGLFAIIGMVGLVLDGGSVFAFRGPLSGTYTFDDADAEAWAERAASHVASLPPKTKRK